MFSCPGTPSPALRRVLAAFVLLGVALCATIAQAAVVNSIRVEGNVRVDTSTVRAYVTITPGVAFGPSAIDESIDTLFATGLFEDVTINQQGRVLLVRVVENPVVSRISFEGNRRITDEILESSIQTRERSVFNRSRVQADVQRILAVYRTRGRFDADVVPQTIDRGQNRVDLVFDITEGRKTEIGRVTFIGNRSFSDSRLRDVIQTKEAGLLGFLRTTDTFDPQRLEQDQELLRRFYFNRGFADFRIISASADFDRERNEFFVTFTLDEGQQYEFGDVRVETTLADLDPQQLERRVESRPGKRYSAERIEKSLEDLTVAANRQGYPFAEVVPTGERDFETNVIDVTYRIDQGTRAFIERIDIVGNTTTRDYVIRREFDISEGDAYNRVLLDRAERRLRALNFFETVVITTSRGSAPDRVVVTVRVLEKATGKIQFGIGYSSAEGVIGDLSVTEANFLGRGQFVKLGVGGGANSQNANFAFTEPYLFGRRISGGFDIYTRIVEDNDTQEFSLDETGFGLRLGLPITDNLSFKPFYNFFIRDVDIEDDECLPPPDRELSLAVCDSVGERITSLIGASLVYSTLDDPFNPREGVYAKGTGEIAGLGGDAYFVRGIGKARIYREIIPAFGVVGFLAAEGGAMQALDENLKVQDQFFLGGTQLRGFESRGVGPRDANTGESLGGRYYVAATAEAIFPVPFLPPEAGLSVAGFADAGSLWGLDPDIKARNGGDASVVSNDFDLRVSSGVGVLWKSPFGPIRADVAFPLAEDENDRTQVFRLSGGTTF